jgi:hypothetical protein
MKQQTCWKILREYRYDQQLRVRIEEGEEEKREVEAAKNVEMGKRAVEYCEKVFNAYKKMDTQRLEGAAIENIFKTMKEGVPWNVR